MASGNPRRDHASHCGFTMYASGVDQRSNPPTRISTMVHVPSARRDTVSPLARSAFLLKCTEMPTPVNRISAASAR